MKDVRLEIKARNNLILRRVEATGYRSLCSFCKQHGLNYGELAAIVAMKRDPLCRSQSSLGSGLLTWRKSVRNLARELECEPGDLFTEATARELQINTATIECDAAEVASLLAGRPEHLLSGDERIERSEVRERILGLLKFTNGRERKVLASRFGLDGDPATYREIGKEYNVTTERIRQVEVRGLRRIRDALAERAAHDRAESQIREAKDQSIEATRRRLVERGISP